ncbi:hypothetical protein GS4_05_01570 [Gordonia soli NBRC 108243]|uniref:Uncharacterized protein n=2 Tax=Gordonia soli TaxID=320799 RepID=M0QEE5_9ACTN|nr:hypothetical protein GS4_05_01570 [Gordonia soli NBRC 108243]
MFEQDRTDRARLLRRWTPSVIRPTKEDLPAEAERNGADPATVTAIRHTPLEFYSNFAEVSAAVDHM